MAEHYAETAKGDATDATEWYMGDYSSDDRGVMVGQALLLSSIANSLIAAAPDREFEIRKAALLAAASATPYVEGVEDWTRQVVDQARGFEAYLRGGSK